MKIEAGKEYKKEREDYYFKYALLTSIILGLVAQILSYHFDYVFAYRDSIFRMEAARRFFDNLHPGIFSQIGTVWLPLPNLLLMPFASIDILWKTGMAASLIYFPAFVLSSAFVFLSLKIITRDAVATWFGFIIFVLNYNVLYFQTTAMTETIFILFILGSFYYIIKWNETGNLKFLIYSSIYLALGCATRYDGWILFAGYILALSLIYFLNREKISLKSILLFFIFPAFIIIWWLIHNYIYFGDVLEFSHGKFSTLKQLEYFENNGRLQTKGNIFLSINVYYYSVLLYSGYFYLFLSIAGLIIYYIKNKFSDKFILINVLLIFLPASVFLLYTGQIIIEHPYSQPPGYFNSRYGLYLFPAIVVLSGIGFHFFKNNLHKKYITILFFILIVIQQLSFLFNFPYSIPSLAEAKYSYSSASVNISKHLEKNYKGGGLLYDNTVFAIYPWAGINLSERITYHTFEIGNKAMNKPSEFCKWIIVYTKTNDKIYEAIKNNKDFKDNYILDFSENGVEAYKRIF